MKERPNLNELAKEIYEANKAKGFHDKEYSNEHYLCLVISELMEAVEADRKGKRADMDMVDNYMNYVSMTNIQNLRMRYKCYIKGSIEEELADAIIRLLDLAGLRGLDLSKKPKGTATVIKNKPLTDNIFSLCRLITNEDFDLDNLIIYMIASIDFLAVMFYQIDIWRHVELKLKYNATRERLHGKRY